MNLQETVPKVTDGITPDGGTERILAYWKNAVDGLTFLWERRISIFNEVAAVKLEEVV